MNILDKGMLKKKRGVLVEAIEYSIALIDKSYLSEALELQEIVVNNLSVLEIYKCDTREFIDECLDKGGILIGIFAEKKMISYRFINFPRLEGRNIGRDLGLTKDELLKVAHFESTLVHPDYVGNGFQRKTFLIAEKIVKELGFNHICTLISNKNFYSVNNILKMGLVIRNLKNKYANAYEGKGKLRYVLYKNVNQDKKLKFVNNIAINSKDIESQLGLLKKGYVGHNAEKTNDGFSIIYGK